ncbi:MAG: DUF1854 domain-containing protein [Clostridia bacterium]|nr:DUF1854 domain-containing protein [Clostridia bacterium]
MLNYVNGEELRLTVNDRFFLDAEFFSGEKYEALEAKRMFPMSGGNRYVGLYDSEGEEVCMIRDASNLEESSRLALESVIEEYYRIPRITAFLDMSEKFKIWMWTAQTDKGVIRFEIRNHLASVKPLFDGRVLIKDADDNRYEIPDVNKLDKKSRKMLLPNI